MELCNGLQAVLCYIVCYLGLEQISIHLIALFWYQISCRNCVELLPSSLGNVLDMLTIYIDSRVTAICDSIFLKSVFNPCMHSQDRVLDSRDCSLWDS